MKWKGLATPLSFPAMLHTLKSYTTTSWIAAQCIPLHFVTLPWPILCQKWLALTVLWWIKELLQLWNRAEFLIHVKSAFLFWRNIFNAACNSPSVLFSHFCSDFCEDKGKIQADFFKSLKETFKICLKEVKIWTSKIGRWKRSTSCSYRSRNTWQWARRFTRQLSQRTKSKVQLDYLNKHRAVLSKICTFTVYLLSTQLSTILWNNTDCSCKHPFYSDTLSICSYRLCPKKLSLVIFYSKPTPTITKRTRLW